MECLGISREGHQMREALGSMNGDWGTTRSYLEETTQRVPVGTCHNRKTKSKISATFVGVCELI